MGKTPWKRRWTELWISQFLGDFSDCFARWALGRSSPAHCCSNASVNGLKRGPGFSSYQFEVPDFFGCILVSILEKYPGYWVFILLTWIFMERVWFLKDVAGKQAVLSSDPGCRKWQPSPGMNFTCYRTFTKKSCRTEPSSFRKRLRLWDTVVRGNFLGIAVSQATPLECISWKRACVNRCFATTCSVWVFRLLNVAISQTYKRKTSLLLGINQITRQQFWFFQQRGQTLAVYVDLFWFLLLFSFSTFLSQWPEKVRHVHDEKNLFPPGASLCIYVSAKESRIAI